MLFRSPDYNMTKKTYRFSSKSTTCHFDASLANIDQVTGDAQLILVTDEHVHAAHKRHFKNRPTIVLKAGEEHKQQATIDHLIGRLIDMNADRRSILVGVGGGVVTDMTGYAASVYMRGIRFGFVPTTILGMVDAAIGGKNGVDVGVYKNLVGTINQPEFLMYDHTLLKSLPHEEWVNGFAEVIKHAAIKDAAMFKQLEAFDLKGFKKDGGALSKLIRKNVAIKAGVVVADELEQGERRLLNFGHTLGHAIENLLQIPHGHAVAIGMVAAGQVSEAVTGFKQNGRLIELIERYELPTNAAFDPAKVLQLLQMDKKKERTSINYVLLERIGKAVVRQMPIQELSAQLLHL